MTNMELIIIICASTVMGLFAGVNGEHQKAKMENNRKQADDHRKQLALYHNQADGYNQDVAVHHKHAESHQKQAAVYQQQADDHQKQVAVYQQQADGNNEQSEEEILKDILKEMDEEAQFENVMTQFKLDRQADDETGQRQHIPVGAIIKVAIPVLKVGSNIMIESIIAVVNKLFGKAKCGDGQEDKYGKANKFRCVSEELWKYIKKYFINDGKRLKKLFMHHHFMHSRRFLMLNRYMEKNQKKHKKHKKQEKQEN